MDEKFVGFDGNTILNAISVSLKYSNIVKLRQKSIMGYEDTNSNISLKLSVDNDSGYISQNVESNSVSSIDDTNIPITVSINDVKNVYVDEDALLEKPQISTIEKIKEEELNEEYEEFGHLYYMNPSSYIASSVISQKTTFSGFDSTESGQSDVSSIVKVVTPLVLHSNNPVPDELENDSNYINVTNNLNVTDINTCDKIYEQAESTSSCLIDDNYSNSFTSALCDLYVKGFGNSISSTSLDPSDLHSNQNEIDEGSQSPCIKSYTELKTKNKIDECNLLGNSATSTPRKPPKPVNPDLSPELFSDDEGTSFESYIGNNSQIPKTCEQQNVTKDDRLLIKRMQESLCGVPPPPSVTILQMTAVEMLQKFKDNENLLTSDIISSTNENNGNSCVRKKSLLLNCDKEDIKLEKWPQLTKYRYHGLHFNRSKIHEDFEHMCVRYAERYIGAETQSSCTVFGVGADNSSPSKRRLKLKRMTKSPGKRLSHLARRRITFSKDSLQLNAISNNNSFIGSRTRQIMIDARKFELLSRRRSPFKKRSPLKLPGRSPRKKPKTPSSSAKKRYAMHLNMYDEIESYPSISSVSTSSASKSCNAKKALFRNSPDKGHSTTGLLRLFGADTSATKSSKRRTPRRALFASPLKSSPSKPGVFSSKRRLTPRRCLFSPDKNSSSSQEGASDKKRKRIESEGEPPLKIPRCTSTNNISNDYVNIRSVSSSGTCSIQIQNIVEHRKKKLMWAVAEALRSQNIDMKHPQFKTYASTLARTIRHFLPNLFVNGPRPEGSTTEIMLRIARQHVFAVTRGKTLDEIIKETKNVQLRQNRPSGYVGLDKVLTESARARNRDNILKLSDNTVDNEAGCSSYDRKENIERIRKVIDFDGHGSTSTKR